MAYVKYCNNNVIIGDYKSAYLGVWTPLVVPDIRNMDTTYRVTDMMRKHNTLLMSNANKYYTCIYTCIYLYSLKIQPSYALFDIIDHDNRNVTQQTYISNKLMCSLQWNSTVALLLKIQYISTNTAMHNITIAIMYTLFTEIRAYATHRAIYDEFMLDVNNS